MNNNDHPNDFPEFRIMNSFTLELTLTAQYDTSGSESNSAASPLTVNTESEIEPLILLAEDNEANIQTFSSYLTAVNYRVILARDGEEAVVMTKTSSPDIILMDIQL